MNATCIYAAANTLRAVDQRDQQCGLQPFTRRTHGYLCANHYRQQQERIPAKPRKSQPQWRGLVPQPDAEVIADIIATDRAAIAEGKIVRVVRGVQDPVVLRILEPAVVH